MVQIHPVRLISRIQLGECRENWTISSVGLRASVYETEGHWFESSIVLGPVELGEWLSRQAFNLEIAGSNPALDISRNSVGRVPVF